MAFGVEAVGDDVEVVQVDGILMGTRYERWEVSLITKICDFGHLGTECRDLKPCKNRDRVRKRLESSKRPYVYGI